MSYGIGNGLLDHSIKTWITHQNCKRSLTPYWSWHLC